jgi:hypothetical protein
MENKSKDEVEKKYGQVTFQLAIMQAQMAPLIELRKKLEQQLVEFHNMTMLDQKTTQEEVK